MAEAIARNMLAKKLNVGELNWKSKGITVISAGTYAMPGSAPPPGRRALRELGIDLSRHRSRMLTVELIHQADIIYTMGTRHAQAVRRWSPPQLKKCKPSIPTATSKTPSEAIWRYTKGGRTTHIADPKTARREEDA